MSVSQRIEPRHKNTEDGFRKVATIFNAHRHTEAPKSITGDADLVPGVNLVDASSASVTVTLPLAATFAGRVLHVKKIDASPNTVTVDGNGAETIDDATTQVITTQYVSLALYSDGAEWWIV